MAVQDRDSFGMWHVTVVPADRSNSDREADDGLADGEEEDDDADRRFEPTTPRHR